MSRSLMGERARPKVVVIGAGFAGLTAAKHLGALPVRTTVVDRNNFHLFTPLLYQVGSALLEPGDIAQPIRSILRSVRNAQFRLATARSVDLAARLVDTDTGELRYDHLVLAAGSTTDFFGNDELRHACLQLKDLEGAVRVRNHILRQFERAAREPERERRRRLLSFVVVGGGPTGVEFCGALAELVHGPIHRDFPTIPPGDVSLHLIEAGDALLAPFAPSLQRAALRTLRRRGIEVRQHTRVERVEDGDAVLAGGARVPAGTLLWAAGVRAGDLASAVGDVAHGGKGTITVGPTLQVDGHPEVYVLGDMAGVEEHGQPLPMLAPVAIQEAEHAVSCIGASLSGGRAAPFHYHDRGIMATIGRNNGVMQSGPVRLSGFPGWVAWLAVHIALILGFRRKLLVLFGWAWNYLLFDRPVRLILGEGDKDRAERHEENQ